MKRRIAVLLLAALFAAGALAGAAEPAALTDAGGEWIYELIEGGVVITRYASARPTGELAIPAEVDGLPVVGIGDFALSYCEGLTGVTIPEGVAFVGEYAFANGSGLRNATFLGETARLGYGAFFECAALTDVRLPEGAVEIGEMAFYRCAGLAELALSADDLKIGATAFLECPSLSLVAGRGGAAEAFADERGIPFRGVGEAAPAKVSAAEPEPAIAYENPIVTIEMESGAVMRLELYPEVAPNTVANFVSLVESGFYDGLIFHRVISGFMIQGGCPLGTGTGNPGYAIKGEFSSNGVPNDIQHTRGALSMARSAANDSAGSQFFIVHADSLFLDGNYAAFGRLIDEEGFAALDGIAGVKTNASDRPDADQRIARATVETFGATYEVTKITGR